MQRLSLAEWTRRHRAKAPKITITQRRMLAQLMAGHGLRASSDWTTGLGRHTKRKAIPPFCESLPIEDAMALPGLSGRQARALQLRRPLVQRVVIVTDRRKANQLLKQYQAEIRS